MQFANWQDFLAMGGYGLFVWLSVGAFALGLCATFISLKWQRRSIWRQLDAEVRRQQRIEALKGQQL